MKIAYCYFLLVLWFIRCEEHLLEVRCWVLLCLHEKVDVLLGFDVSSSRCYVDLFSSPVTGHWSWKAETGFKDMTPTMTDSDRLTYPAPHSVFLLRSPHCLDVLVLTWRPGQVRETSFVRKDCHPISTDKTVKPLFTPAPLHKTYPNQRRKRLHL